MDIGQGMKFCFRIPHNCYNCSTFKETYETLHWPVPLKCAGTSSPLRGLPNSNIQFDQKYVPIDMQSTRLIKKRHYTMKRG